VMSTTSGTGGGYLLLSKRYESMDFEHVRNFFFFLSIVAIDNHDRSCMIVICPRSHSIRNIELVRFVKLTLW
jgi:hypothetical protein